MWGGRGGGGSLSQAIEEHSEAQRDYEVLSAAMRVSILNTITKVSQCSCMVTSYQSSSLVDHDILYLDLAQGQSETSVQGLLDGFGCQFPVDGGQEDVCSDCRMPLVVRHQYAVQNVSDRQSLVLILRRSSAEGEHIKNRRWVSLSLIVILQNAWFALCSFAQHLGRTAAAGHYLAWVREQQKFIIYDGEKELSSLRSVPRRS